jgi:hypothetical protein
MAFWTQQVCCLLACAFGGVSADFKAGAECGVAVSDSVTSLIDASDYMYKSVVDCGKAPTSPAHGWLCSADISNIIASVAEMSRYTVNVFGFCFDKHTPMPKCVRASLKIAQGVAELSAAIESIYAGCVNHVVSTPDQRTFDKVGCVVDLKKLSKNSLETIAMATSLKNACDHQPEACASKVLNGASGLAGITEYIIAAFYDCRSKVPMNTQCGRNVAKLIKAITKIGSVALHAREDCDPKFTTYKTPATAVSTVLNGFGGGIHKALGKDGTKAKLEDLLDGVSKHIPRRRYDSRMKVDSDVAPSSSFTLLNGVLCAAIPVALALGFFGGRMRRGSPTRVVEVVESFDADEVE